jgi:GTP cyclohydrolase I
MSVAFDRDERAMTAALDLRRRHISDEQMRTFEGYVAEMFAAFGMDLGTESTRDTPRRFVRALYDSTIGYEGDPKLRTVFQTECRGEPDCTLSQIIEGPIPFHALCEHHAFPFFGRAYIGYIAHEHIIGISKLTRLARVFARRFTVQERVGQQIADTLDVMLEPHGVAVYLEANHLCTAMRGVQEASPLTRTTVWRGEYATSPALRNEFLTVAGVRP